MNDLQKGISYTQDLTELLQALLLDSNHLLGEIKAIAVLGALITHDEEKRFLEIVDKVETHFEKQNIELETFAKIKGVDLKAHKT